MPLPININDLINGNTIEWERIEFKKGWNPDAILHTITAFANDINNWGGGYVVVGIEEYNGRPVFPPAGLNKNDIDGIQKELLNLCNQIKPIYYPVAEPVLFQGKHILIIWVPGGQTRPYSCPVHSTSKSKEQTFYVRRFSNTVKAKESEKVELYELAGKIPFDDRINHHANISDIKMSLVREFLYEIKSRLYDDVGVKTMEDIGKQMNLTDGSAEYLKPKNIALMMFNEEPHHFFPYAQIELVHFRNDEDIFTEKIFHGPLNFQIKETLRFISNMILQEKVIKIPGQAEAVRIFNYPYEAIEEAVVNAVYHKSYEIREPIEIRIYSDRIIILNYPGPDKSIRQKDIESGKIISRRY